MNCTYFNPNFVPGDQNQGRHIMAGYLEFFLRSNSSPTPLFPISYKDNKKSKAKLTLAEDDDEYNYEDFNFYQPRYRGNGKPLKSILKKNNLFGWSSTSQQYLNRNGNDIAVDSQQKQTKKVHFEQELEQDEESQHANFPKEAHDMNQHIKEESDNYDNEGESENCESEMSTDDETSEEPYHSIFTYNIKLDRRDENWFDDFEQKVVMVESFRRQYANDIAKNNKKMTEKNRHENWVYYGFLSTDEWKNIKKKNKQALSKDISKKYEYFRVNLLKKMGLIDEQAMSYLLDNLNEMLRIRTTILMFNGYQFIDHYKEWNRISSFLYKRYNMDYSETQIRAYYLKYFYLFDLFQSWNLSEDHYYILENFKSNRIKTINEYRLKVDEKLNIGKTKDKNLLKKQIIAEELQKWINNNWSAVKITNYLKVFDISFDDIHLQYFIELYPKSEVVITLQNHIASEIFAKSLQSVEIRTTLEVAWEGEIKGLLKNKSADIPKSNRVYEITSSLHDKPNFWMKFESNFPRFIVPDKSFLMFARSNIIGVSSPEILFIQPGFTKKWKSPYLGFNEYYLNISDTPVWFYIIQPIEERSFRNIISNLQRRTITVKRKMKDNSNIEKNVFDKVNPFDLDSFDENISVYPEYFASNNWKVITTQLLKGELLIIKKGWYYQYFTKITRSKLDIKMLHWHCPFQSKEQIEYSLQATMKWMASETTQFITPYTLLMDFINLKIGEVDREMLIYFSELFFKKLTNELDKRNMIIQIFKNKILEKAEFNSKIQWTNSFNIHTGFNAKENIIPVFEQIKDNQQFNYWDLCYRELFLYYVEVLDKEDDQFKVLCWDCAFRHWFSIKVDNHHHKDPQFKALGFSKKYMISWIYQLVVKINRIFKEYPEKKNQSRKAQNINKSSKSLANRIEALIYNGNVECYFPNQRIPIENIDKANQTVWYKVKVNSKEDLSDPRLETFQKSFSDIDDTHDSDMYDAQMTDNDISRISDLVSPSKLIINDQIYSKIKEEAKSSCRRESDISTNSTDSKQKKREIKEKKKASESATNFSAKKFEASIIRMTKIYEESKDVKSRALAEIEYYNPSSTFHRSLSALIQMNICKEDLKTIDFPAAWKLIMNIKGKTKPHKKYLKMIGELMNKWRKSI